MSNLLTLGQVAKILAINSPFYCDFNDLATVIGITTDTRSIQPGEVFLALQGEHFDGHDFVEQAINQGAIAAIVNTDFGQTHPDLPLLPVPNPLKAYQQIARWWRDQFQIPIIGVTGSVGKTTTKELIAAVLGTQGKVLKTQANYNNEIGVPKTLLQLTGDHDFAVIEMAMRGAGQIAELTQIARPTIGVITNVGTAHIGLLGSEDAIAQAKCELLAEMPKTSLAVLNQDQERLIKTAAKVWSGNTITYGLAGGDLQGELIDAQTLRVEGVDLPLPLPGEHNASNFLAALAVFRGIFGTQTSYTFLQQPIAVQLPDGRAKRYEWLEDIVVLDETYNAGLESMLAALRLLAQTPGKRHIAVLGTMKELGERSLEFHEQVGRTVRELNLDGLLILADFEEANALAKGAGGVPLISIVDAQTSDAHAQMAKQLKALIEPGDRILFKASHSVQLNRVVELLGSDFQ
ncbi:UDP-N-acetylmuramoyl-tripeptide--D-alanyl-D-alanine ligase [Planktothrix paucivesiculata]|uniref:UDP-N-acetylmuramoyl-tripeptide--D-alanyl-D-alanine ligase n=1 Tax=Planktothrix paucivesiculata PCC 9631 TaxID=671071 RepID=A0A7Z9E3I0_9CYAN|nr:UDP-N-acetylmuramoyl-tripeptide--D-alanyl-D-alanine ligase [Planktothrix paucivesiculata]VXD23759.1 UDP-N-acetylmuramoyl-tripeptide--D-alanyl-D-alanine ligase [Planktothrix paucivesiculata PCC 9631]